MYAGNIHLLSFDSTGIDLICHPKKEMSLCLERRIHPAKVTLNNANLSAGAEIS